MQVVGLGLVFVGRVDNGRLQLLGVVPGGFSQVRQVLRHSDILATRGGEAADGNRGFGRSQG